MELKQRRKGRHYSRMETTKDNEVRRSKLNGRLTQEWRLVWRIATPDDLSDLKEIANEEGVKLVVEAVNKLFHNGFKEGRYKFWYFHSEGETFTKVIVSEQQPNYDMILTGEWPALGMVMFRAEDEIVADIWKDLARQIGENGGTF